MISQRIKHLIFDLGGVIINLDTRLTIEAFAKITGNTQDYITDFASSSPVFHQYEKGEISSDLFRNAIREVSHHPLTDEQIDDAWNAMILDLPLERIALIEQLKKAYDIFLLSNTNYIHMERVNQVFEAVKAPHLSDLFHKDYYSHLMGKRKPDTDIFEQVIEENKLDPENALFLDDNLDNTKGAEKLGIQTLHVTSPQLMMDFFDGR